LVEKKWFTNILDLRDCAFKIEGLGENNLEYLRTGELYCGGNRRNVRYVPFEH